MNDVKKITLVASKQLTIENVTLAPGEVAGEVTLNPKLNLKRFGQAINRGHVVPKAQDDKAEAKMKATATNTPLSQ